MIPLKEDVVQVYRALLGRDPESEQVIRQMQNANDSVLALVLGLQDSEEYRARVRAAEPQSDPYVDTAQLERFRRPVPPLADAVTDWMGVRTARRFSAELAHRADFLEPAGLSERDAVICTAMLRAVEGAASRFCVADIGAGWGRWAVNAAKAAGWRSLASITVIAAEPQRDRFAAIGDHMAANGIEPSEDLLFNGVIAPTEGPAWFSLVDAHCLQDTAAIFPGEDRAPDIVYEEFAAVTLSSLLARHDGIVDFCCADVPRAGEIIAASAEGLARQVRCLVAGTDSRREEALLLDALQGAGFTLEHDRPCQLATGGKTADARSRGLQIWSNGHVTD